MDNGPRDRDVVMSERSGDYPRKKKRERGLDSRSRDPIRWSCSSLVAKSNPRCNNGKGREREGREAQREKTAKEEARRLGWLGPIESWQRIGFQGICRVIANWSMRGGGATREGGQSVGCQGGGGWK